MISSFKRYLVEEEKTVYFTFGRMNPPTIGHEKLLQSLAKQAGNNPYKIYLSNTQDSTKNPLPYKEKIKFARKMFPRYARQVIMDTSSRNIFDILTKLYDDGFKNVAMVVGSDRLREFNILLNKYNGKKARHGFYNFNKINVLSAGDRDPDADGAKGMSASKMRSAASSNDFTSFSQGLPKGVSNPDAKALYNAVRKGMGLKEQKHFKNHIQLNKVSDIRESYVNGTLYNIGDQVYINGSNKIATVKHLGANYVILDEQGYTSRKWLKDVSFVNEKITTRQDPDIADKKGTQPAKYQKPPPGMKKFSKSTKAARDAQFKKQAKMADDNPAAYKDAPGDKQARKKGMPLSKYTKFTNRMLKVSENYNKWTNQEPVEYSKHLEKTFGPPDELTDSQLCWFAKDGFKRIVIKDEYILHGSPAPHYDFIYCYIDLQVPEKHAKALAESSGSILIDYLKGEVGARCGSITANATTLNYVLDVVAGRAKPSKEEYEKRILGMKKLFSNGKKFELDWWPDESNDADPKNPYYKVEESLMSKLKKFKIYKEDAVKMARDRIDREKERINKRHTRMLNRATLRKAINKNRERLNKSRMRMRDD